MTPPITPKQAFDRQVTAMRTLGSPFMSRLMRLCRDRLDPGTQMGAAVQGWPGDPAPDADNLPLRLAGALHALRLEGLALDDVYPPASATDDELWSAVARAMQDHAPRILRWLDRAPQTNEVRRTAVTVPALHLVAAAGLPIRLVELGCSGGLNLAADRFRVVAGDAAYGPADSPVTIVPDWQGPAPAARSLTISDRIGIDLAPLDPAVPEDRLRLLAYLWPDQPDRLARTNAAIAVARDVPVTRIAADIVDWLERDLAPVPGRLTCLVHTIALQYLDPAARARAEAAIDAAARQATAEAPLARISMEPEDRDDGAVIRATLWPGRPVPLGRADYHGRWVRWEGPVAPG